MVGFQFERDWGLLFILVPQLGLEGSWPLGSRVLGDLLEIDLKPRLEDYLNDVTG